MAIQKTFKPLPEPEQRTELPGKLKLRYFLYRNVPNYYEIQKKTHESKLWLKTFSPTILVIFTLVISALIWIATYTRAIPPSDVIMRQAQHLNMISLMIFAYMWGFGCKLYKSPIPRGLKYLKF